MGYIVFVLFLFVASAWRLYESVQYNGGRHYNVDPVLLPLRNSFKYHEEVWSLQPMIPPNRFDISSWGILKRSRCVQIFL